MTTQSERDIVERLREKHKAWNEQCDKWEAGLREIEAYDEVIFASTRETVYGEAADLIASLRKELDSAKAEQDFIVRWAWLGERKSLSDEERLSAIKYYPTIKDRAEAIRRLSGEERKT